MIACTRCGSLAWWRCCPGEAADASPLPPQIMTVNVCVLPQPEIAALAWCVACDPLLTYGPPLTGTSLQ